MATLTRPPRSPRTLVRLAVVRPHAVCEMGDEDGCDHPPEFMLHSSPSFAIPLYTCMSHAVEEMFYCGTTVES